MVEHPHDLKLPVLESLVLQDLLDCNNLAGALDRGLEHHSKGAPSDDQHPSRLICHSLGSDDQPFHGLVGGCGGRVRRRVQSQRRTIN